MLDQEQKHELIEKVIAAQVKELKPEIILKSFELYTYAAYESDTKGLIEDAVEYKVISGAEADKLYNL